VLGAVAAALVLTAASAAWLRRRRTRFTKID
jgi:hypothetical protein